MAIAAPPQYYDVDGRVPTLRVEQITVPLTPVLLMPSQLSRLRAILQNSGPNAIFIGPDANVTINNGYKVANSVSFSIFSTVEVWAVAQTAACSVSVLTEQLMSR